MPKPNGKVTSVSLDKDLHEKWCKRLPKYGDRSKVLAKLIEDFVEGKYIVMHKGRQL